MDRFISWLIATAVVMAVLYLMCALIGASWDPFEWHWVVRLIGAVCGVYAFAKLIEAA